MELTPNQIVSANVRRIRERAGLTQAAVADRLGWSAESYAQAERAAHGQRVRRFDADDLYELARALDTSLPALLCPPPKSIVIRADDETESPIGLAVRTINMADTHAELHFEELRQSLQKRPRERLQRALEQHETGLRAALMFPITDAAKTLDQVKGNLLSLVEQVESAGHGTWEES